MAEVGEDVQRSLGRIEGAQEQILSELKILRINFAEHKADDTKNFNTVREMIDELKQDSDRTKGAGWVLLGIFGLLATFLGGAFTALFTGWVKL